MTHTAAARCETCAFRCPDVCEAKRRSAFRAARAGAARAPIDPDAEMVHYHRFLVAAICRMTGRFEVARDLAHDVFVKALINKERFRHDAQFTTWLYAIARNRCYDFLKAAATARQAGSEAPANTFPVVDNGGLRALEVGDARRTVVRLMHDALLEPVERKAFVLHYAGDVPLDELTRDLQLHNRSGAKAQIVSARRKLARAVTRWQRRQRVRVR